jgi:hypothetical protein
MADEQMPQLPQIPAPVPIVISVVESPTVIAVANAIQAVAELTRFIAESQSPESREKAWARWDGFWDWLQQFHAE